MKGFCRPNRLNIIANCDFIVHYLFWREERLKEERKRRPRSASRTKIYNKQKRTWLFSFFPHIYKTAKKKFRFSFPPLVPSPYFIPDATFAAYAKGDAGAETKKSWNFGHFSFPLRSKIDKKLVSRFIINFSFVSSLLFSFTLPNSTPTYSLSWNCHFYTMSNFLLDVRHTAIRNAKAQINIKIYYKRNVNIEIEGGRRKNGRKKKKGYYFWFILREVRSLSCEAKST